MSMQAIKKIEMELKNLTNDEKLFLVKKIINSINSLQDSPIAKDFSKYEGLYKNINVEKETNKMRNEWERNI